MDDARHHLGHTPEYYEKWAPDLYRDPVHRVLDSYHIVFPILLFVAPLRHRRDALAGLGRLRPLGLGAAHDLAGQLGHPRLGLPLHETRDTSTNLWWVALLTYGEGWHNNHHAFQTSARHGLRWWEVDMTYVAIRVLSAVGLAHGVKLSRAHARVHAADRCKPAEESVRRNQARTGRRETLSKHSPVT